MDEQRRVFDENRIASAGGKSFFEFVLECTRINKISLGALDQAGVWPPLVRQRKIRHSSEDAIKEMKTSSLPQRTIGDVSATTLTTTRSKGELRPEELRSLLGRPAATKEVHRKFASSDPAL